MASKIKDLVDHQINIQKEKYIDCKMKFSNSVQRVKTDFISFAEKISSEYYSCIKIRKDIDNLLQAHKSSLLKFEEIQKKTEEKNKVKQTLEQKFALKSKLYNLHKRNLGFEIKPIAADPKGEQSQILISFNNINKSNPEKKYSFCLVVHGQTYSVTDCIPPMEGLDELLTELNKTDDLRSFVLQARRKFCLFSSTKEPLHDSTNHS